jgi:hypothetical protein
MLFGRVIGRRHLAPTLCLAVVLTGCASMQNAPPQNLAYDRVKKCEGITSSIALARIEPDGRIVMRMRPGTAGYQDWHACEREAAKQQAAAGSALAPLPLLEVVGR